jgi:hypothetical protein
MEYLMQLGGLRELTEFDYYNYAIGEKAMDFLNIYKNEEPININGHIFKHNREDNLNPIKFYCKLVLGESGNIYIYRKIIVEK